MTISRIHTVKKTILLVIMAGIGLAGPVFSQQKKTVQLEIGFHGSYFLVFDDAGWGYGSSVKLLLPMEGNENYITAGLTLDRLRENRWFSAVPEPVRLINAVGGYRKMLRNFFVEPQMGIGFMIETDKAEVRWESDRTYAIMNLFPGIESGVYLGKTTISLGYRLNFRDPFEDAVYSIFSIKAGYRFGRK